MTTVQFDSGAPERPDAHGDPRALSQAWYDALYGSRGARDGAAAAPAPTAAAMPAPPTARVAARESGVAEPAAHAPVAGPVARPVRETPTPAVDGPPAKRAIARRVGTERTSAAADASDDGDALATLATDGVALAVRRESDGVRVVATCRPDAAVTVEDALARARIALAARGIRLSSELSIRGSR